jgi:ataxia telangiectasia mutated family protein
MNNNSIPGLSAAIRAYTSDKFKERSQGLEQIRDIFDNRDNVSRFQETASREGGAGWVAFFQCLFQVVVMEKKAVLKKAASAQGTLGHEVRADG